MTLGSYLGAEPSEITFDYNKYRKPDIKPKYNPRNIKFNVSHSANLAIYAISQNREIGVDLEYIREVRTADKIIKRFFTKQETDFYHSQPEGKKNLAFFTLWTRKEAYSKARGMGIGLSLKRRFTSGEFELVYFDGNEVMLGEVTTYGHFYMSGFLRCSGTE